MLRKLIIAAPLYILAFVILFISVLRSAAVRYDFSNVEGSYRSHVLESGEYTIDYELAYPGRVLPDSPFWQLKVLRDKVWIFITTNDGKKAELNLLFADKRLASSKLLFENGKPEYGMSALVKAEGYLLRASEIEKKNRANGEDTDEFLLRLSKASIKHALIIEEISTIAPGGAFAEVHKQLNYPKIVYVDARNILLDRGVSPPNNPFNW